VNPGGVGYVAPGASAGLATSANAATASINPLPGWPITSTGANEGNTATTPIVYHTLGFWFGNDTTLYVGDEGAPGVTADCWHRNSRQNRRTSGEWSYLFFTFP
jgi:hypothetical protein